MNQTEVYDEYNNLCTNIKSYRLRNNLTQEKLAEKAKCSISYIKQIESKKDFKNVSFVTIINICKALNISVSELFQKNK